MIGSIRHKALAAYWTRGWRKGLGTEWLARLDRTIAMLDAAKAPEDMNYPDAYLHSLSGSERCSVRLIANTRVTFAWQGKYAEDIDVEDYH